MFKISDHLDFDEKGRAVCPNCEIQGKRDKTLSLIPESDGAYKCFRGCTPAEIRNALGNPKPHIIPTTSVKQSPKGNVTLITPQKVRELNERLTKSTLPALDWLKNRGFTAEMIQYYKLGLTRKNLGAMYWCIVIPLPNEDQTGYYPKLRVSPWADDAPMPWYQKGIPARIFETWRHPEASETWIFEGEWDAMMIGWQAKNANLPIVVASFTAGAGNLPPLELIERLPGTCTLFYDLDDAGSKGSRKVAAMIGERARAAIVPHKGTPTQGYDASDAINQGFTLDDFAAAATAATRETEQKEPNPLKLQLIWNDELLDTAPDYTEWLVPDLFTANEMFLLAAGPRAGKSLMSMCLARGVAQGGLFMDRPCTQGTVIYVRREDGDAKTKERELAQGWERGLPVAWLRQFKLSQYDQLRELALEMDPRLIVLDTLSRIKDNRISESSAEMSQVLEPLQDLCEEVGTCIVLVHHTTKVSIENAASIDIFDTIRGSGAIRAVCRGSAIIAADDKNYRLVVENGWGKHDLKVVLDAHTLNWRMLGKWNTNINNDQKGQVLDLLRQTGAATLEQIHEATAIPKKSLYEVLSRLQRSEIAEEKVVKEGGRRKYTYRLAVIETIQLLNSVLNSSIPNGETDSGYIQQKNIISLSEDQRSADQNADHFDGDRKLQPLVEYPPTVVSNADGQTVLPIPQAINSYSTVEYMAREKSESADPYHSCYKTDESQAGEGIEGPIDPDRFPPPDRYHSCYKIEVGTQVKKRHKRGWVGVVKSMSPPDHCLVTWTGDKQDSYEKISDLEIYGKRS